MKALIFLLLVLSSGCCKQDQKIIQIDLNAPAETYHFYNPTNERDGIGWIDFKDNGGRQITYRGSFTIVRGKTYSTYEPPVEPK